MADTTDMAWHRHAERALAESEVIAAGFPCQDISLAGEGAGLAGSRSGLVWSLLRTIRLVRPRYAVLENVAALLGRGLDQILGHMAAVGYDAEWHCIPASAVGAPHRRDRVWIIAADAGGQQHEGNRPPLSGQIAAQLSLAFADAPPVFGPEIIGGEPDGDTSRAREMAYADGERELQPQGSERAKRGRSSDGREEVAGDANGARLSASRPQSNGEDWRNAGREFAAASWWAAEPAVGRVADGVPNRVDRLRSLGNAVVPQIPEIIGRAIMNAQLSGDRTERKPANGLS